MKIQISFAFRIKSNLYLIKIQISFIFRKKKSNLYLMKMQNSFVLKKKSYLKIQISFVFL